MGSNALLFGWNRSIPGREKLSAAHFQEFVGYVDGLQADGSIESYDVVFLNAHGGDLNGFFLMRGDSSKLSAVMSSAEWEEHMTRAALHLQGAGAIRGVTGEEVAERMALWGGLLPD